MSIPGQTRTSKLAIRIERIDSMPMLARPPIWAIVGGLAAPDGMTHGVVQIAHCSAVLVAPAAVLTSAHCVEAHPSEIRTPSQRVGVRGCRSEPGYESARSVHDLAICDLDRPIRDTPIPLDEAPLIVGTPVQLAGYGQTGALTRDGGILRTVDAQVGKIGPFTLEAGTDRATACRGDSGGPLFVLRDGTLAVAGIIHGGAGAMCGSPTEVVPVHTHQGWVRSELARVAGRAPDTMAVGVGIALGLAVCLFAFGLAVCVRTAARIRSEQQGR
jgi:hypothetical protein